MQDVANIRWYRRRAWLGAVWRARARARTLTSSGNELQERSARRLRSDDDELRDLLQDRRLVSAAGSLVTSHLTGIAASFMSECCEEVDCPKGAPFAENADAAEPEGDGEDDEDDGGERDRLMQMRMLAFLFALVRDHERREQEEDD